MSRTYALNAVQVQSNIRLDSFVFQQAAFRGQVGTGGFTFDDVSGVQDLPAMKAFTADESAATPTRFFAGYTAERAIIRGPLTPGVQRQWDVTVEDANAFLDDLLIGSTGDRGEETDHARITWLLGEASMTGVAVGVVPNTNTVTMGPQDYRGEHPRKVLDDCSQKSGKNFFLYDTGTGYLLWYDLSSSTSLTSTLSISDDPADVDSVTVFGPSAVSYRKDPARVFSTVRLKYSGGVVTVTDAGTATAFRTRESRVENSRVKTSARATELAQKQLDNADSEQVTVACSVSVPASLVTAIRAGMRIQLKLRHAGITAYTYYRVKTCSIQPRPGNGGVSDVEYLLRLELMDAVRPTHFETVDDADEPDATLGDSTTYAATVKEASYQSWDDTFSYGVVGSPKIQSAVSPNTAYTTCGCPLGAGGWGPGVSTRETWYEFTLGALDATWVGLMVSIPDLSAGSLGVATTTPIIVGWGTPSPTALGAWAPITSISDEGGTVFIPRSYLTASAVNALVLAPSWAACGICFFCAQDLVDGAGGPVVGGEGNSGRTTSPTAGESTATAKTIATRGIVPWMPGVGAVSGANRAFTLIAYDQGPVRVRVDGLELAGDEFTHDGAGTVTLDVAPPTGADVRFRYLANGAT